MSEYKRVAAEWVEQSPGQEGLDPEAVHALYEHCQYLDMVEHEDPKVYLRAVWRMHAKNFAEHGRGEDAAWMVAVERMAANA